MEIIYYENMKTNERVYEEELEDYAMEKLGIKIEPKGKYGVLTSEQSEFIEEFTDWYFSGEWIKKEEKDNSYEPNYYDYMSDKIYEENLEKRLLGED